MDTAKNLQATLLLIVLSFVFYARSLNYEFVWDDERAHLTRHVNFMSGNLKAIWKPGSGMYIPFSYTAWYGIKKISEDHNGNIKPLAFRLANLLLHGLNASLVFALLSLLIKNSNAALMASVVFLIHPLQTESVVWISEFRGLLAAFFAFLSLCFFLKEINKREAASEIRNSTGYLVSTLLFLLALLSKPSVIILPLAIVAIVWFFYPGKIRACLYSVVLWLILIIPFAVLTGASSSSPELRYVSVSPLVHPLIAAFSYAFYFLKIVLPSGLSPCYGITPVNVMNSVWPYVAVSIVIGGLFLVYRYRNRQTVIAAGIVFLVIALLPVSGFYRFDYQRFSVVADRYVYFGMFGVSLVFAQLWIEANRMKWLRYLLPAFLFFMAALNYRQIPVWKNELSVWQAALKSNPEQWTANFNLGVHYMKQNQPEKAVAYYTASIKANPYEKTVLTNRANSLARLRRFEESLADYAAAIKLDENDGSICYNRALTFYNMGELDKCFNDLQEARERAFPFDEGIIRSVRNELKSKQKAR